MITLLEGIVIVMAAATVFLAPIAVALAFLSGKGRKR